MADKSSLQVHQVYHLASACTETLLYGFYACLFMVAIYLNSQSTQSSSKRGGTSVAHKIFMVVIVMMFLNATLHEVITIYRVLRAYGFMVGPKRSPIHYYMQADRWDNYSHSCMTAIMAWMGDFLVIIRCYIIWGNNLYIIILPTLLTMAAMGVNLTLFVWWGTQFVDYRTIKPVTEAGYPLMFAQNVLTTGLIIYKIVKQHRASRAAGLVVVSTSNSMSLLSVAKIIVESALPYTLTLLMVIVLSFLGHPLLFVARSALIPCIGIVFVLIAIRTHIAREDCEEEKGRATVPSWLMKSKPVFQVDLESSSSGSDFGDDDEARYSGGYKVGKAPLSPPPARALSQPHYKQRKRIV